MRTASPSSSYLTVPGRGCGGLFVKVCFIVLAAVMSDTPLSPLSPVEVSSGSTVSAGAPYPSIQGSPGGGEGEDGVLIVCGSDGSVTGIDIASGDVAWRKSTGGDLVTSNSAEQHFLPAFKTANDFGNTNHETNSVDVYVKDGSSYHKQGSLDDIVGQPPNPDVIATKSVTEFSIDYYSGAPPEDESGPNAIEVLRYDYTVTVKNRGHREEKSNTHSVQTVGIINIFQPHPHAKSFHSDATSGTVTLHSEHDGKQRGFYSRPTQVMATADGEIFCVKRGRSKEKLLWRKSLGSKPIKLYLFGDGVLSEVEVVLQPVEEVLRRFATTTTTTTTPPPEDDDRDDHIHGALIPMQPYADLSAAHGLYHHEANSLVESETDFELGTLRFPSDNAGVVTEAFKREAIPAGMDFACTSSINGQPYLQTTVRAEAVLSAQGTESNYATFAHFAKTITSAQKERRAIPNKVLVLKDTSNEKGEGREGDGVAKTAQPANIYYLPQTYVALPGEGHAMLPHYPENVSQEDEVKQLALPGKAAPPPPPVEVSITQMLQEFVSRVAGLKIFTVLAVLFTALAAWWRRRTAVPRETPHTPEDEKATLLTSPEKAAPLCVELLEGGVMRSSSSTSPTQPQIVGTVPPPRSDPAPAVLRVGVQAGDVASVIAGMVPASGGGAPFSKFVSKSTSISEFDVTHMHELESGLLDDDTTPKASLVREGRGEVTPDLDPLGVSVSNVESKDTEQMDSNLGQTEEVNNVERQENGETQTGNGAGNHNDAGSGSSGEESSSSSSSSGSSTSSSNSTNRFFKRGRRAQGLTSKGKGAGRTPPTTTQTSPKEKEEESSSSSSESGESGSSSSSSPFRSKKGAKLFKKGRRGGGGGGGGGKAPEPQTAVQQQAMMFAPSSPSSTSSSPSCTASSAGVSPRDAVNGEGLLLGDPLSSEYLNHNTKKKRKHKEKKCSDDDKGVATTNSHSNNSTNANGLTASHSSAAASPSHAQDNNNNNTALSSPDTLQNESPALTPFSTYRQLYIEKGIIGEGGYGTVWLAENATDQKHYAVKKIRLKDERKLEGLEENAKTKREAALHSSLDHPNIARYNMSWEEDLTFDETLKVASNRNDPNVSLRSMSCTLAEGVRHPGNIEFCKHLFIVMKFYEEGSLRDWLTSREMGGVDRRQNVKYLLQLTEGLRHLHSNDILHRDMKPSNILVEKVPSKRDVQLKICDFGLSVMRDVGYDPLNPDSEVHRSFTGAAGTPLYASPEQNRNGSIGKATDIFSLGLVFYELFLDQPSHHDKIRSFGPIR